METMTLAVLGIFLAFLPVQSKAADATETICKPASYAELVRCAEKSSAEIKISEQQLKSSLKLEDAAKQWINPELDAESVQKGAERSETTASLLFTLRIGNKRGSQIKEAQGEIARSQAEYSQTVQEKRLQIMLALYRVLQLKTETAIELESVQTFTKIVNQFEKRPALNPEQSVSLAVFKMALGDHSLRLTSLRAEEEKLLQLLSATTGISRDLIQKNLPLRKQSWPELKQLVGSTDTSLRVKKAIADYTIAESLKEKADAAAWPDIKIGPTVRSTKDNGNSDSFVGLSLSMPLPVFSLNGGSRNFAEQKKIEAAMRLEQTKTLESVNRAELVSKYTQTINTLKNTISLKTIDEQHEQIEKQFFRGLVPSSLVIEAHRQLFDLEERRNLSEMEALEALGQVLIIDNKFYEVIL